MLFEQTPRELGGKHGIQSAPLGGLSSYLATRLTQLTMPLIALPPPWPDAGSDPARLGIVLAPWARISCTSAFTLYRPASVMGCTRHNASCLQNMTRMQCKVTSFVRLLIDMRVA